MMIGLHDKIRVRVQSAGPLERSKRNDGRVGSRKGQVEKKGLFVMGAGGMPPNLVHRLLKKMGQHLLDVKIRSDGALAIPSVAVLSLSHPLFSIRYGRHTTRIHPDIRRHIQ